jgi:hypothetical protein
MDELSIDCQKTKKYAQLEKGIKIISERYEGINKLTIFIAGICTREIIILFYFDNYINIDYFYVELEKNIMSEIESEANDYHESCRIFESIASAKSFKIFTAHCSIFYSIHLILISSNTSRFVSEIHFYIFCIIY